MPRKVVSIPLEGISFESAVCALKNNNGFVAIDNRNSNSPKRRFSIVASSPISTFISNGAFVTIDGHTSIDTPLSALQNFFKSAENIPHDSYLPFCGGIIGYASFEGIRALTGFAPANGFTRFPQCQFGLYHTAVILDHAENFSCLVSCSPDLKAANIELNELKERLEKGSSSPSAFRLSSSGLTRGSIEKSLDPRLKQSGMTSAIKNSAFQWLRSECLESIHLVNHTSSPSSDFSPEDHLLTQADKDSTQAIFIHEGAAARVSSPFNPDIISVDDICKTFSSTCLAGKPFNKAMSFIVDNEESHRSFHGGVFGVIQRGKATLQSIHNTVCTADGVITQTSGVNLTISTASN